MPLTEEQRKELIDSLIENCDCWDDDDRELLANMSDDKLTSQSKLVENASHDNKADDDRKSTTTTNLEDMSINDLQEELKRRKQKVDNREEDAVISPEDWLKKAPPEVQNTFRYAHQIETEQKNELIGKLTAHITDNAERKIQEDRLRNRSLEDLKADLVLLPAEKKVENEEQTQNKQDDNLIGRLVGSLSTQPEESPLVPPAMSFNKDDDDSPSSFTSSLAETTGTPDAEEWLRKAPAGIRALIGNALEVEKREKDEVITALVSNVDDSSERFRLRDRLESKPLSELKEMLTLVGNRGAKPTKHNYTGAAPAVSTKLSDAEMEDILPLPALDFDKKMA